MFAEKSNPDHYWRARGAPGECSSSWCTPHGCTAAHKHAQHQPGALPTQHHGLTAGESAPIAALLDCMSQAQSSVEHGDGSGALDRVHQDRHLGKKTCQEEVLISRSWVSNVAH